MKGFMAAALLVVCSSANAQSVATFGYDAQSWLIAVRDGTGFRSDYNVDAADNRVRYQARQQFTNAYAATSLPRVVGYADSGGWPIAVGQGGDVIYGPYTTSIPVGNDVTTWRLLIANNSADNAIWSIVTSGIRLPGRS